MKIQDLTEGMWVATSMDWAEEQAEFARDAMRGD